MASGSAVKKYSVRLVVPLLILIFCLMTPAQAQKEKELPVDYLAGFAFFKYARVEPDFRTWVFNSRTYKSGTPRERANMLRSEVPRLQNIFSNYVIDDHPIYIETPVKMVMPVASEAKRLIKEEGMITVPIQITQDTGTLFAIPVSDMWIALIPEGLDEMLRIPFTEEDYAAFRKNLSDMGINSKTKIRLALRVLPTGADTQEPLIIKDFQLWMLLAKVISFELRTEEEGKVIWYKGIEGYDKQNSNQDIYNLFKQ